MEPDYELYQAIGYVRSCAFLFVCVFVGVAAVVAGAKLKKSVGVWVFAVSTLLFALVTLMDTAMTAASLDYDIARWIYAFTSMITLVLNIAMLIGMALIKPLTPGGAQEVRG